MEFSTKSLAFYIHESKDTIDIIGDILNDVGVYINDDSLKIDLKGGHVSDTKVEGLIEKDFKNIFSNRIYFYSETQLDSKQLLRLYDFAAAKGLLITIRSTNYMENRQAYDKPVAFISHDWKDKDKIARPLAEGLSKRLCSVWYDEYSLRVGDSLRESIEKGIREVEKCIVVLTKNYLNNHGWGKYEFDSIFTRERINKEKIIIPIWYGVKKEDIFKYSTSLPDTIALIWPSLKNKDEEQYKKEVEQLISKLHTALTGKSGVDY
ncbi:hypothetical protein AHMF7616_01867 [Adhaeribacter pallidiroseus]|uniref:TIR domain-containing protein n=2 Tax=Adhaeribacter pallidiroseus TaxID=2072847 RepID=A0A369QI51_9BACT|nr:hypothetical protein AHMF7616_01867 [Adhaeribacter pallidiroseus]